MCNNTVSAECSCSSYLCVIHFPDVWTLPHARNCPGSFHRCEPQWWESWSCRCFSASSLWCWSWQSVRWIWPALGHKRLVLATKRKAAFKNFGKNTQTSGGYVWVWTLRMIRVSYPAAKISKPACWRCKLFWWRSGCPLDTGRPPQDRHSLAVPHWMLPARASMPTTTHDAQF